MYLCARILFTAIGIAVYIWTFIFLCGEEAPALLSSLHGGIIKFVGDGPVGSVVITVPR